MKGTRIAFAAVGLTTVVLGACTAGSIPTTTSSTTTIATTTTLGGRITLLPNSTPFILQGTTGPYVEALQFYLVCTGHDEPSPGATVSVDGNFGPITADAVAWYQAELRRIPSGDPDEATFASLARDCTQARSLVFPEGVFAGEIGGNAAPGDDEIFEFAAGGGQVLSLDVAEGAVTVSAVGADGTEIDAAAAGTRIDLELDVAQAYTIRIQAAAETSYRITTALRSPNVLVSDFGPMTLADDGIGIASLGDDPVNTVAVIALLLGAPHDDSGWETGVDECTGSNRHVTWVIQGAASGSNHPAFFVADFTDTGGTPYFSQFAYHSEDLATLDPIARGLTTEDGLTIGSTYDDFVAVFDIPDFVDADLGLVREGEVTFGFDVIGSTDSPDGAATRIWYVGAGEDGCPDFP
jgi:peptidoglycan hydrolase-like protein with peptidoglycan-binding domain